MIALLVTTGLAGLGIALARFRAQAQVQTLLAADRDVERSRALAAKEQVDTARRKLAFALTDMHTSQGLVAGQQGDPAQAVLWFANAARLALDDPAHQRLNRIRARTWARARFHSAPWLPPHRRLWGFRTICLPSHRPLLVGPARSQEKRARFTDWVECLGPGTGAAAGLAGSDCHGHERNLEPRWPETRIRVP